MILFGTTKWQRQSKLLKGKLKWFRQISYNAKEMGGTITDWKNVDEYVAGWLIWLYFRQLGDEP